MTETIPKWELKMDAVHADLATLRDQQMHTAHRAYLTRTIDMLWEAREAMEGYPTLLAEAALALKQIVDCTSSPYLGKSNTYVTKGKGLEWVDAIKDARALLVKIEELG